MTEIALQVDDGYQSAINRRVAALQETRVEELRRAGREDLADEVAQSEPNAAQYVKNLIKADLESEGIEP